MPSFLIFGCANFYGRALMQHLCAERDRAAAAADTKEIWTIRGVDKVLPRLASFPEDTLRLYETFDYRMGNLRSAEFLEQAFAIDDSSGWDYVFDFAPEYKFGQSEQVYEQDVFQVSVRIAQLAQRLNAKLLVHLSTAHIFKPTSNNNKQHPEDDALEAPNPLVHWHVRAEEELRKLSSGANGLAAVILRPALCYGPGDRQNVVPILISAQLSRESNDKMPVLWDKAMRVNTVHVADVARAAVATARWWLDSKNDTQQQLVVFNLADPGDTTNAKLAAAVGSLFGVEPSFHNTAFNYIAKKLKTSELTEEVNESLLGPWMDLLTRHGVANSPLSPYLDQEHPYCSLENWPLGVDGSKITNTQGLDFTYAHETVSAEALRPIVEEFQQLGLWPNIPLP
ncbi:hypothetical protein IW140_004207 [Coemansia sp. RSA 1813]|nr:hypothetical protein EV178_004309 [Coemansia sp. RSA 1646]KAJ1767060.1 hypothetical protein LPJ74_005565 [Coemansia sp. RSA 1843]KAJ2088060.1 hypothetical protein IW138_004480 [Coemansia sp. RSA 986]KAJ2210774.1 hypothetical protein EV179_006006 [Coemansia sp. RSA 487]KAJ2568036.1 hypothetical protein IW140_004207 [Coemansia sp. RSA 1813]